MASPDDVEAAPVDPGSLIRSRQYRVLLVLAAIIGVARIAGVMELPGACPPDPSGGLRASPRRAGVRHRSLVVAAALACPGRRADSPCDPPPTWTRGPRARRGSQGRRRPHTADRAPRRSPGGARHPRSRARARPGGTADRTWHGPRGPRGSARQKGCAPAGVGVVGRRRELCRHLNGVRLAGDRRGDPARGCSLGWRWTDASGRYCSPA